MISRPVFKILITLLALIGAASVLSALELKLMDIQYWDNHGFWFLVFLSFFPRLTLLFSSVATGGLFWWLGWLFTPRLLVAVLATIGYFKQNPLLVGIAWLIALGGESGEKLSFNRYGRRYQKKFNIRFNGPASKSVKDVKAEY